MLAGAEEGIFLFMNVVLGPGDHAVVIAPAYQSLYQVAEATGAAVTRWALDEANGWEADVDELERLLRPNTRAIVVNFPHNPTGYLPGEGKYRRLVGVARRRGLYLFSDEKTAICSGSSSPSKTTPPFAAAPPASI